MSSLKSSVRNRVLRRDSHSCELCGSDETLEVHHKDGDYPNNDMDNLITLCRSCHMNVHHGPTTEREKELADQLLPRDQRKTGDEVGGSTWRPSRTKPYKCTACGFEMPSINGPSYCPECGRDEPLEKV